ncbi:hypothetical protein HanPI659440_Chr03g0118031 [Helianthus annuus]|nr:hypothetical protein HanPI659440_Chr03g0118031 [Helianthus annuus]
MARLSLATRKRKQRRTLILIWWNQLVTTVSLLILSLYMLIFKYLMDKPRIGYSSSKIDRYSILYRYVYGDGDEIGDGDEDNITYIETSNVWTTFRNNLAQSMFDAWNVTNG